MNSVVLTGRLVHDPKLTEVNGTMICGFRLAVEREFGKGEADFINCKVFSKTAENLTAYKKKGDLIGIKGRIRTGSYKNKNGDTVYTTEVIGDRVEFLGGKNDSGDSRAYETQTYNRGYSADDDDIDGFEAVDEDAPF